MSSLYFILWLQWISLTPASIEKHSFEQLLYNGKVMTGSSMSSCHLLVVVENTYLHLYWSSGNDCVDKYCEIKSICRKQRWRYQWFISSQYWDVSSLCCLLEALNFHLFILSSMMKKDSLFAWFHLSFPCALGKHLSSVMPFSSSDTLYSSSE